MSWKPNYTFLMVLLTQIRCFAISGVQLKGTCQRFPAPVLN